MLIYIQIQKDWRCLKQFKNKKTLKCSYLQWRIEFESLHKKNNEQIRELKWLERKLKNWLSSEKKENENKLKKKLEDCNTKEISKCKSSIISVLKSTLRKKLRWKCIEDKIKTDENESRSNEHLLRVKEKEFSSNSSMKCKNANSNKKWLSKNYLFETKEWTCQIKQQCIRPKITLKRLIQQRK